MFKRIIVVMMLSISVASAAGLGQIFDGGADLIRNLLKKMNFDGKYIDEFASTFDEAAKGLKKTDAEDFISAMKRTFAGDNEILTIIGKDSDEMKYDDLKKIFDKVVAKSNITVSPKIRNMVSMRPVGDISATRTAVTGKTKRGITRMNGFDTRKVNDDFVQKLYRAMRMGESGTTEEKRLWRAWKNFSEGGFNENSYWTFLVDGDKRDLDAIAEIFEKITKENPGSDTLSAKLRVQKLHDALEDSAKKASDRGDDSLKKVFDDFMDKCAKNKCAT